MDKQFTEESQESQLKVSTTPQKSKKPDAKSKVDSEASFIITDSNQNDSFYQLTKSNVKLQSVSYKPDMTPSVSHFTPLQLKLMSDMESGKHL